MIWTDFGRFYVTVSHINLMQYYKLKLSLYFFMRDIYIFAVWTKDPKDLKDVGSNLKGYLAPLVQALLRCEMSSNINYYYLSLDIT